jgi:hypothetical protein
MMVMKGRGKGKQRGSPESLAISEAYHQNKINISEILFEMQRAACATLSPASWENQQRFKDRV